MVPEKELQKQSCRYLIDRVMDKLRASEINGVELPLVAALLSTVSVFA